MEITPLIPDGHDGPIKRLSCTSCRHYFYVSQEDYQSLRPLYCHECSLKMVELERRKAKNPVFKEAVEQAEQGIQDANDPARRQAAMWKEAHRIVFKYYSSVAERVLQKATRTNPSLSDINALAHELIKRDLAAGISPYRRLFFGADATPDNEDYKQRNEQGRVILELMGNTVHETRYNDRPDAKYKKSTSSWNLADKRTNKHRPDLVVWAESIRKKTKTENADNSQKDDAHGQED